MGAGAAVTPCPATYLERLRSARERVSQELGEGPQDWPFFIGQDEQIIVFWRYAGFFKALETSRHRNLPR
jgi:hypothetical protein